MPNLTQGLPAITPAFGGAIAEACAICLTDEAHEPGVILKVVILTADRIPPTLYTNN